MSAKTRRQRAQQYEDSDLSPSHDKGNGTVVKPKSPKRPKEEPKENVFLFAPNLIGKSFSLHP